MALATEIARQMPDDPRTLEQLALVHLARSEWKEAEAIYRRLTGMQPVNPQFQTGLAFKTFGVSSLSCVSKGDQVLVRNPGGPRQCIVQSVTYQTPAMDRADLAAAAKKH